ncbi:MULTISPECIES: GNAT family N-acetyltransferase [Pseudoalteromonas]|uniref:GNAT family N-acetyltransferase n=1 Tax=Pseudoalteromonas amylolytica TaxID=1859457 RepID=A0A1S1MM12_9GAMM|nr:MULTISPECIES: GNAT family N-acetyltransferase [Pseudoalteromonas]OHU86664.1 GNAT family N-acetyltransferase [Pseudoalteromonas sp. JW3]OHU88812.1 GNAT family N-acetyltransferase [Pseudoalteromonas amylolytica]
MKFEVVNLAPSLDEFISLRSKVGWTNPEPEVVKKSLDNSLFHVCVLSGSNLVGCGRVVGDGAMYFYIQDVIVDPSYQKQGLGKLIMSAIESFVADKAVCGATVALLAAFGKERFYEQFGYVARDGNALGLGMCKFVD